MHLASQSAFMMYVPIGFDPPSSIINLIITSTTKLIGTINYDRSPIPYSFCSNKVRFVKI